MCLTLWCPVFLHMRTEGRRDHVGASGFILMLNNTANITPSVFGCSHNTHTSASLFFFFYTGLKRDFMDGLRSNHLQLTNQWETQGSQTGTLNNHQEKTQCQENLSNPHEGWQTPSHTHTCTQIDTHTHKENQGRSSLTVAHISSFTLNDSWCLCAFAGFKIPYEHIRLVSAATPEVNERVNIGEKKKKVGVGVGVRGG